MKKSPAPRPSSAVWIGFTIAVVSIGLNFALLWQRSRPRPAPASEPAASAPRLTPELAPYAALGSYVAENNRIADLKWTPAQFAAFQDGFRSSYEGRGLPLDERAGQLRDDISRKVQAMVAAETPDPVRDYFRFLREKENVQQAANGLHYRIIDEGTGEPPKPGDVVVISSAARLPDGKTLPPLSRTRFKVAVKDLMPGLAQGVQLLRVGGKALIYVPPALAFAEADWPPAVPKGVPIAFLVELHDINPAP
jgi:FKBP-type peptidyl-prolyl cis-trans isomerase FkpA